VLSDAVNLAARVEGMTKKYGVELLITGSVYEQLHDPDAYLIRELDRVKPKGKSIPVTVYEVFDCLPDDVRNKRLGTREQLAACIALYRDQSFEQALVMLEKAKELDPDDLVFALYEERCQRRMLGGVTMDWDGVESWETK
jgi:adenylate cyclase